MIKTIVSATIMATASLMLVGAAAAQVVVPKEQEFYATPVQHGAPVDLPGQRLIPGARETALLVDQVLTPVIVVPSQQIGTSVGAGVGPIINGIPILGNGGMVVDAGPAAGPGPRMRRHRHHHHAHAHHMHSKAQRAMHIQ